MQLLTSTTTSDDRSDTDLLLAYGRNGDEAAFEALARRHVDMVFAVSLRRSGNRQLAEEATQNVLLCLSSKARKLSAQESNLTGWLHTTTKFEVAKLQRRETRIKLREQAYATDQMKTPTQDDDETFRRLLPVLDQAIDHLRAPDREVIVRRYLEGQDFRRIGEELGISEDAAQKRTSRAFDALNHFFKRKAGVTVSTTALAAGISRHCAEAAPAVCLQIAGKAASAGLATTLINTVITTMSIGKIAAIAAGVAVIGGAIALINSSAPRPLETASSSPPSNFAAGPSSTPQPTDKTITTSTGGKTTAPADAEKPYSPNEELAKLEAMSPHPSEDEMARRLSVKHEQLLKDLTADLSLSDTQVAGLKKVLDTRLKDFRASLDHKAAPGVSPEQKGEGNDHKSGRPHPRSRPAGGTGGTSF
jgi:RNA polymerase sigma factor (sigma-70 family)